jgi:predicted dehydrogenase
MSKSSTRLNVGIIGAGYVATSVHIPFLKALPTANVLAVADSIPGKAAAAAERYGIPSHTSDYRNVLHNKDIHVVDICTPPQFHARIAIEAIAAGKDVIVEKPMAMNQGECAAMNEALTQAPNSHVGVVLNLRYMPLIHSVLQALHSGRLGEIRNVSAVIHTVPPAMDGFADSPLSRYGVLYDYAPHIIDLVLWGLQADATSVRCVASSPRSKGFYLVVDLRSPIAGDCSLLMDVAWTSATSIRSLQVWGSERDLFLDMQDQFWYLARGHLTPQKRAEEFVRRGAALAKRAAGGRAAIRYGGMIYHRELLRDFIAAFATKRCPKISLADGIPHVAVIEAAVRSHMEDRAVTVSTEPLIPA